MSDDKIKRNDLYIFKERDSAYKVIKAILLDFFTSGFQSSNYVMNGQFSPESQEEMEFVLQCLQSDFEELFAKIRVDGGIHNIDNFLVPISHIFELQGVPEMKTYERKFLR